MHVGEAPPRQGPVLVCFPHAGGVAADYRSWKTVAGMPVAAVTYPGRERRFGEPLCTSVDELAVATLGGMPPAPWVLFGHSLGALVAFEVARRLSRLGRAPSALVVAGQRAPDRPRRGRRIHDLPVPDLLRALDDLGGMDPRIAAERDLLELLLPRIRADLHAAETYAPHPSPPLAVPVLALGGAEDEHVTEDDVRSWGAFTTGPFAARMLAGGHFFVHRSADDVRDVIQAFLGPISSRCTDL